MFIHPVSQHQDRNKTALVGLHVDYFVVNSMHLIMDLDLSGQVMKRRRMHLKVPVLSERRRVFDVDATKT